MIDGVGPRPGFSLMFANYQGRALNPPGVYLRNETFQAQLPEGKYRVSWNSLPVGYFIKAMTSGTVDLLAEALTVSTGSPPPPIVLTRGVNTTPPG